MIYAVDVRSGAFAGYTEIMWHPESAEVLGQGETGVLPDHRNKGLGRWLKAAMLERVLEQLPQARLIRTSNAASKRADAQDQPRDGVRALQVLHCMADRPAQRAGVLRNYLKI